MANNDEHLTGSGRLLGEDDSVINVADVLGQIKTDLEEMNEILVQIRDA